MVEFVPDWSAHAAEKGLTVSTVNSQKSQKIAELFTKASFSPVITWFKHVLLLDSRRQRRLRKKPLQRAGRRRSPSAHNRRIRRRNGANERAVLQSWPWALHKSGQIPAIARGPKVGVFRQPLERIRDQRGTLLTRARDFRIIDARSEIRRCKGEWVMASLP